MPHSEAIQELIAAADRARIILRVGEHRRDITESAATSLDHALAAVEAEEKPQTHEFKSFYVTPAQSLMGPCAVAFCRQPSYAPIHQIGGNNGK